MAKQVAVVAIQHPKEPNLYLHGKRRDNSKWCLPAGKINPNEEPIDAAKRELFEETGINANDLKPLHSQEFDDINGPLHVHLFKS